MSSTIGGYPVPLSHNSLISNPDQKVLDMRDKIFYLNPSATPLMTLLNKLGKQPCQNTIFSWMEDEYYTMYGGKCITVDTTVDVTIGDTDYNLVKLTTSKAIERQAFEASKTMASASAGIDEPTFQVEVKEKTGHVLSYSVAKALFAGAGSGVPRLADVITSQNEVFVAVADDDLTDFLSDTEVSFETKSVSMQAAGWEEGSGLGGESVKRVRFLENLTQIFKTSYSTTGTSQEVQLYGGGTEYDRLRARKAAEHKLAMEYAFMFNGVATGKGTATRTTMGLGIGSNGTGFIKTKGNLQWAYDADPDPQANLFALYDIFENILEDGDGSQIMMVSQKWRTIIQKLIQQQDSSMTMIGESDKVYGMNFDTLRMPAGDVKMVWNPQLRGKHEDYAAILNFNKMTYRPLGNRDTKLFMDVASQEIDGQVDYYLTEAGLEVQGEHENAIIKLV